MRDGLRRLIRPLYGHLLWNWFRLHFRDPFLVKEGVTLIVAPHPDDETFGCAGLIAAKRERNIPVHVVFLTDGRQCFGADYPDKDVLAQMRRTEAVTALSGLGITENALTFLDLPDGGLKRLSHEQYHGTVCQLTELVERLSPIEVLAPYFADCHSDHEAAYLLIRDALENVHLPTSPRLIEYLIWGAWEAPLFRLAAWKVPRSGACLSLNRTMMLKKRKAVAAYVSQLRVLPKGFVQEHLRPSELYFSSNIKT